MQWLHFFESCLIRLEWHLWSKGDVSYKGHREKWLGTLYCPLEEVLHKCPYDVDNVWEGRAETDENVVRMGLNSFSRARMLCEYAHCSLKGWQPFNLRSLLVLSTRPAYHCDSGPVIPHINGVYSARILQSRRTNGLDEWCYKFSGVREPLLTATEEDRQSKPPTALVITSERTYIRRIFSKNHSWNYSGDTAKHWIRPWSVFAHKRSTR